MNPTRTCSKKPFSVSCLPAYAFFYTYNVQPRPCAPGLCAVFAFDGPLAVSGKISLRKLNDQRWPGEAPLSAFGHKATLRWLRSALTRRETQRGRPFDLVLFLRPDLVHVLLFYVPV